MNRSKRGKRERATRGERGKVDEGWPRGSKISGFRGTRHTRSRIFGRVRFLERHGSIEGDREHARPLFFFFRSTLDRENSFSQFSAIYRMEMCTSFIFLLFPFLLLSLFATRKRDSRNNYNVSSSLKTGKRNASSEMKRIQSMSFRRIYIIDRSPSSYKLDQSSCNYEGKTDYRYIECRFSFFSSIARIKKRRKISLSSSISIRTSWSVDLIPNDYPPPSF